MWGQARAWVRGHAVLVDAALGVLVMVPALFGPVDGPGEPVSLPGWLRVLTVASCLALALRRRWPVAVWVVAAVPALLSVLFAQGPSGALLPMFVALYTVATRIPTRRALAAGAVSALGVLLAQRVSGPVAWSTAATYPVATWCLLATLIGVAVRNQRAAVSEARARALAAEESREEEAQRRVSEERLRIARELHDVVAHHIAVVNVQSGVAEHLLDANPAAAREALAHVRSASGEVLAEMGTLLGVLRSRGEVVPVEPARGLADLDGLVESFRRAGLRVVVRREGALVPLAPLLDVTAYRVLEEALTNARKHGTGDRAEVVIAQTGTATMLEVRNTWAPSRSEGSSGDPQGSVEAGHGLVGMRERVTALGGLLAAGPEGSGWFVVRVELPTVAPVGPSAALRPLDERGPV